MRCTACLLVVVATLAVHASCQNLPKSTTESDDDLNLDPDMEDSSGVTKRTEMEIKVTECTTAADENGVCVAYYLCDQTKGTVIEDGYTIIDIRAASSCANFLEVCCQRPQVVTTTPAASLPAAEQEFAETPKKPAQATFSINFNPNQRTEPPIEPTSSVAQATVGSCGYSNPGANLFPVRDSTPIDERLYADMGEFPWMVAILRRTNQPDTTEWNQVDYIGGGSLIHPSVVITVAHKVAGLTPNQIIVRAGEFDTNSNDELYEHQDRNVAKIILHENFEKTRAINDVGLLILETPVNLVKQPHIGIGCLAPQAPMPGATCFSMGWGRFDFHNKSIFAAILKKVKLPIVERNQCEKIMRSTRLGIRFTLHPSLLCAGGQKNIDTCRGDGGSPLVCSINPKGSRYAIYGMVAYGISCGLDGVPGMYVNSANIYEWVGQQFRKEGLNTESYINT